MKKKTNEEYIKELKINNPTIGVVEQYINFKMPIKHKCNHCEHEWSAAPGNILNGAKCPQCTLKKLKLSQEDYISRVNKINPHIKVIGEYVNNHSKIWHKCNVDEHLWMSMPSDILSGYGCPVCGKRVIGAAPEYKNSIWASEFKEYLSQFLTEEQMKSYMPYSSKKVNATCPNCKTPKETTPALLIRRGIKCQMCSDGVSYPNKFCRAFLSQIDEISYIKYEYSPDWLVINGHKCFYDIYFVYQNNPYIIEVDGMIGHGNSDCFAKENDTHSIKHDKKKEKLASKHNIQVIRIDAKKSNAEYLKASIMNSKLPSILNFQEVDINWIKCEEMAITNLMMEAGKLWDNGFLIKDIAVILGVSRTTAKRYLLTLSNVNKCTYSKELARQRVGKYQSGAANNSAKKTIRLSDLKIYKSATEAAKDNNITKDMIYSRCKNRKEFMYYDEWLKQQNIFIKENK